MKKRIGNDMAFIWHISRSEGGVTVPESFAGKDVVVELLSPTRATAQIEDVEITDGTVRFTFPGRNQTETGNYTAVLYENRGENGMVTLDVVRVVTLVAHSCQEEPSSHGDEISTDNVEFESDIDVYSGEPIEVYTKAETNNLLREKQNVIEDLANIRSGAEAGTTAYQKPQTGIPSTDMSEAVRLSLGKAESALQEEADPTVPSWAKQANKPDYTASEVGAVPTTRKVNNKSLSEDINLTARDVGALPDDTPIPEVPVNVSAFYNDAGYITDVSGKEDKQDITSSSGTTLSAEIGKYYRRTSVGTLTITLPTITGATKVQGVTFMLQTSSSPSVTFRTANSATINYQKDFAVEANGKYEVTALWNGSEWTLTMIVYQ